MENSRKSKPYSRRLMRKKRMRRMCVVLLLLVRMTATKNIVLMMTEVNTRMENRMIQTRELAVEEESSGRETGAVERFRRKCCGSRCGVSWNSVSPGSVTVASSVEIMVILVYTWKIEKRVRTVEKPRKTRFDWVGKTPSV